MSAPSEPVEIRISTNSPDATVALGRRLGGVLEGGDVLGLIGPLGAGKTVLVKGIALGLGVGDSRDVTSPTFVLMHVYGGRLSLCHFDAYRLNSASDMVQIGCEEAFYGEGVSVVEWADRVAECLPADHVAISIEIVGDTAREIRISGRGTRAERVIGALGADRC